jgi:hypothetical protein
MTAHDDARERWNTIRKPKEPEPERAPERPAEPSSGCGPCVRCASTLALTASEVRPNARSVSTAKAPRTSSMPSSKWSVSIMLPPASRAARSRLAFSRVHHGPATLSWAGPLQGRWAEGLPHSGTDLRRSIPGVLSARSSSSPGQLIVGSGGES